MSDYQALLGQVTDLNRLSDESDRSMKAEIATLEALTLTLIEVVKHHPYLQSVPLGQALISIDAKRKAV
jgi:hypothetical protein